MCVLLLVIFAILALAQAADSNITCYGVNGLPYPDQVQCPGSNACCSADVPDACLSNRLCRSPKVPDGVLIRGPCTSQEYDFETCAQVCVYNETAYANLFPRVTVCSDGSLCCSNQQSTCCEDGLGVFINNDGVLVSSSTASSSSASATTSSTQTIDASHPTTEPPEAATTSPTSVPQSTSSEHSGENSNPTVKMGVGVGIGLGVPLIAIVSGISVCVLLKRRRNERKHWDASSMVVNHDEKRHTFAQTGPAELSSQQTVNVHGPVELQ
ncbi:hypothetical protein BJ170DRAFT_633849 [Xylariales sp. AK1849]|nr:hypothetical protein BJ170DRAFT_633849 [Xylariales sp. AK1849]